ncbi:hypothetical protein, partial [Pseudomonas sp. AH2 (2023)]|uniref:hypothetical protein n=1 Tax=Pseudomonas sp. AH2 (2023) TaxID=3048599 RepID=UPI002B22D976
PAARLQSCDLVRKEAGRIASKMGSDGEDDVANLVRSLFPGEQLKKDVRRPPTAMRDILLGERGPVKSSTKTVLIGAMLTAVVLVGAG